jgi:hypothetical protein
MSAEGRSEAAERWHTGDYGPDSSMARSTKRVCSDCGFFLSLDGSLGTMFGVCGNELSADGHIVDKRYGCGAHSDTPAPAGTGSPAYEPYDDGVLDVTQAPAEPPVPSEPSESEPELSESQTETAQSQTEPSEPELSEPELSEPEPESVIEQPESQNETPD